MCVAKEDMPHVVVPLNGRDEVVDIHQPDSVEIGNADPKRRVMHEQKYVAIRCRRQLLVQPIETPGTVSAGLAPFVVRIQKQESTSGMVQRRLHEPLRVERRVGQRSRKSLATVVISEEQSRRYSQSLEQSDELAVAVVISAMHEIAGDHAECGVLVPVIDLSNTAFEARTGVETMHALAAPDEMGIGEMNELQHRLIARRGTR